MRISCSSSPVAALLLLALGCAGLAPAPGAGGIRLAEKIAFDAPRTALELELDPTDDDVELADGRSELVARYRLREPGIEIVAWNGESVGFVARATDARGGFVVLGAAPAHEPLYALRREPDGDLELSDRERRVLYKLKRRDYGLKVVRPSGEVESRVRRKGGKISVRDTSGRTVLSTRAEVPVEAAACLSLVDFPLEYAAALGVAIIHWGPPPLS